MDEIRDGGRLVYGDILASSDWKLALLDDSSTCPRCGSVSPVRLGRELGGAYGCSECASYDRCAIHGGWTFAEDGQTCARCATGSARYGPIPRPIAQRLWDRVPNKPEIGCWEWQGARTKNGYGLIGVPGGRNRNKRTHRVSYELAYGPIPDGLCVLHRCDNPPCVRPEHLFLGTRVDNNRDRDAKGRTRAGRKRHGEASPLAKLTSEAVAVIRREAGHTTVLALARRFGVSETAVRKARDGETWAEARNA